MALLARIPEAAARELYVQQAARRLEPHADHPGRRRRHRPARGAAGTAAAGQRRRRPPVAEPTTGRRSRGPPLTPAAAWDGYLATLCVHRPELAARLTGEFGLDVGAIGHPLARRMVEIALATPAGESFPLTSLAPPERDFAAALLVRTVPELLPESRTGDLDTAIARQPAAGRPRHSSVARSPTCAAAWRPPRSAATTPRWPGSPHGCASWPPPHPTCAAPPPAADRTAPRAGVPPRRCLRSFPARNGECAVLFDVARKEV